MLFLTETLLQNQWGVKIQLHCLLQGFPRQRHIVLVHNGGTYLARVEFPTLATECCVFLRVPTCSQAGEEDQQNSAAFVAFKTLTVCLHILASFDI